MTLLLAEDDAELAERLRADLCSDGHTVMVVSNGKRALELADQTGWDVIVMDVNMPGLDGFQVVEKLRYKGVETPIIFLTARAEVSDRVEGLSIGADDYLTKPFAVDELKARLEVLNRRFARARKATASLPDGWTLDAIKRCVFIDGQQVDLQPKEWSLLDVFIANEGKVITKTYLLDRVWGIHFDPGTNVVDSMVSRLRRKVDTPGASSHIEAVKGRGYLFKKHV